MISEYDKEKIKKLAAVSTIYLDLKENMLSSRKPCRLQPGEESTNHTVASYETPQLLLQMISCRTEKLVSA
jgi:hypothetical protein